MLEKLVQCPVCGKLNLDTAYTEAGFGIVEEHYYCDRCTYFVEKCYSPTVIGISSEYPKEYDNAVKKLGLHIYQPEEMP